MVVLDVTNKTPGKTLNAEWKKEVRRGKSVWILESSASSSTEMLDSCPYVSEASFKTGSIRDGFSGIAIIIVIPLYKASMRSYSMALHP